MLHEEARQEQAKNRNTPEYFAALRLRKIWCEGNFSHQKAEHNLRRTYKRGIERVTEQCLLSACAMNLIRLVKAANAVFFRCLGVIVQGLFHLGYLSTAPKLYRLPGALGNIGLISPVNAHFCGGLQPHSPDGGRQGKTLPPLQCGVRPEGAGLCGYARSIGKGHLEQACVAWESGCRSSLPGGAKHESNWRLIMSDFTHFNEQGRAKWWTWGKNPFLSALPLPPDVCL